MHYYQHHIGDFIKATARLTDGQAMAYLRLLWMYYDSEKPLKPDAKVLAFQIGATVEETELLLESFFWLADSGWHHTRCDEEIAEYRAFLAKKSNAGRASAERRRNSGSTGVDQVLNESETDVQLTNNHITTNQETNNQKKTVATKVARPESVSPQVWEDWLSIRKAKKLPLTETSWTQILTEIDKSGHTVDVVIKECCLRGWAAFKVSWLKENPISQTPAQAFAGDI